MYSLTLYEKYLTLSSASTSHERHSLFFALKRSLLFFCQVGFLLNSFLAQAQEYSTPSPASSQWHFGILIIIIHILHPFDCNSDSSSMKSLQFYHQMLLACVHLLQPHSICLTFYRILIQPCWINPSMFPKTLQQTLLLPTPSWHKLLYFFFCWNVVFHANFFYFFYVLEVSIPLCQSFLVTATSAGAILILLGMIARVL